MENRDRLGSSPVFKAGRQTSADPFEFVLSDETVDRQGDVIRASGWNLSQFRANPVALFAHNHEKIVGTWTDVRVEAKRLIGRLQLAAPGTSEFIDTVRSLIDQRILRAVSVGFMPVEGKPRDKGDPFGGFEYTKSILHEVSVVAVPANPAAISMAKAFNPIAAELLVQLDAENDFGAALPGQSVHKLQTPKLMMARQRLKSLGLDKEIYHGL